MTFDTFRIEYSESGYILTISFAWIEYKSVVISFTDWMQTIDEQISKVTGEDIERYFSLIHNINVIYYSHS